jgi:thiamine-monophosphate kinase
VEGVHFRLDWISWRDLGWRAAAVNLSDLAARGADPEGLVVTLAAPDETRLEDVLELYEGIAETGVRVVGGDTTAAEHLMLSVSAVGRSERVPGRSGAFPGNLLVVSGPLGGAGAAFRRRSFSRPPLRLSEGKELARHAHALLDLSDGIAVDAALDDLGFGEDYELLAAVDVSGRFPVIGRCEDGEGVLLTRSGEPYELGGWEHFR